MRRCIHNLEETFNLRCQLSGIISGSLHLTINVSSSKDKYRSLSPPTSLVLLKKSLIPQQGPNTMNSKTQQRNIKTQQTIFDLSTSITVPALSHTLSNSPTFQLPLIPSVSAISSCSQLQQRKKSYPYAGFSSSRPLMVGGSTNIDVLII